MTTIKQKALFKEHIIKEWIWKSIPTGSKFIGNILGSKCNGRIFKDKINNEIFLCQNIEDGERCDNTLGYKYSYCINEGDLSDLEIHDIIITSITLDPDFKIPIPDKPFIINHHTVLFYKDYIKVGCTKIPKSQIEEILKRLNNTK